jgi:hypothetical protein
MGHIRARMFLAWTYRVPISHDAKSKQGLLGREDFSESQARCKSGAKTPEKRLRRFDRMGL